MSGGNRQALPALRTGAAAITPRHLPGASADRAMNEDFAIA
jgi:hypothetical protein